MGRGSGVRERSQAAALSPFCPVLELRAQVHAPPFSSFLVPKVLVLVFGTPRLCPWSTMFSGGQETHTQGELQTQSHSKIDVPH